MVIEGRPAFSSALSNHELGVIVGVSRYPPTVFGKTRSFAGFELRLWSRPEIKKSGKGTVRL
jgi:hypothetical protein